MTAFVFGAVGALAVLLLFIGGAIMGWKARETYTKHLDSLRPAAPELQQPSPEELKQFMEDQEAFSAMLHYSPERAYGLVEDELQELARKET